LKRSEIRSVGRPVRYQRFDRKAVALFRDLSARQVNLAVSCVTVAELYAGMRPGEEANIARLIDSLDCIPLTAELAKRAGLIRAEQRRLGRTFALDDLMIGATAVVYRFPLITDNRKDFEIPDIEIYPGY
jgi:predicted nucleic acid-binding protein